MLVDEVSVTFKAGNGGGGAVSFKRNAQTAKGGPDGGNGGNGGNVYIQGVNDITALSEFNFKKSINAEDGIKGGKQNLYGRNGKDILIFLPLGCVITNLETNEELEIKNTQIKVLIAKGGKGGRGNNEFKTATDQAPYYAEKGGQGEEKKLLLELKLIADVGLIGLPNAGKSSLLESLTNAHPKIGNYSFTTLEPNLGVMEGGIVVADIPGLIEGASKGKGLGDRFLRHVERTKILVHCLDVTSENPYKDYQIIREELKNFSLKLLGKKEIILLTKIDLVDKVQILKIVTSFKKHKLSLSLVSIYDLESLSNLKKDLEISLKSS